MSRIRSIPRVLLAAVATAGMPGCGEPAVESLGPGQLPSIPPEATRWLEDNVVRLDRVDPSGGLEDLEPLRSVIGDARIVALGEATHGTREFFLTKHRILRFLVEEMAFNAFAMEASWPEGERIDGFVTTGTGDAEVLLSGLYAWIWNTREVLDLIHWLRSHNEGAASPVRYFGFDMQFPGMALLNLESYVADVDPGFLPEVVSEVECLERYANDPTGAFPDPEYSEQLRQAYRDPCRQRLDSLYHTLLGRRAAYEQVAGSEAFNRALQSLRVVIQFEDYVSSRTPNARDLYMAENVTWILDRLGPDARLVVWAHNYHVADMAGYMGRALRLRHGDDVVLVGFNFFRGSFNAGEPGVATLHSIPEVHSVAGPLPFAYGHFFDSPGIPRFLLDLRRRDLAQPGAAWLDGPRPLRNIGTGFDPGAADTYFWESRLPEEFDVIVYVRESSPSTLLPFRYPEVFRTAVRSGR